MVTYLMLVDNRNDLRKVQIHDVFEILNIVHLRKFCKAGNVNQTQSSTNSLDRTC
jgi:hypothetical protein